MKGLTNNVYHNLKFDKLKSVKVASPHFFAVATYFFCFSWPTIIAWFKFVQNLCSKWKITLKTAPKARPFMVKTFCSNAKLGKHLSLLYNNAITKCCVHF